MGYWQLLISFVVGRSHAVWVGGGGEVGVHEGVHPFLDQMLA